MELQPALRIRRAISRLVTTTNKWRRTVTGVEASDAQVAEFAAALSAQLAGRRIVDFARSVSEVSGERATDSSVYYWMSATNEPSRAKVFAIERVLGLKPGSLSRHLGYLPVGAKDVKTVADAIASDGALDERGRRALLALYRELTRG